MKNIFLFILLSTGLLLGQAKYFIPSITSSSGRPIQNATVVVYPTGTTANGITCTWLNGDRYYYTAADSLTAGAFDIYVNGYEWVENAWIGEYDGAAMTSTIGDTSTVLRAEWRGDIGDSLDAGADGSSIERTNGQYNVKASGVTNTMLAGNIDLTKIASEAFGGKPLRFFGGIAEQTTKGGGWEFTGGQHTTIQSGITLSTSGTPPALVIQFPFSIDSVIAFNVTLDTDFARMGIYTGIGMGLDNISVKFFVDATIGGQVRYTTEWLWFPDTSNRYITIDTTGWTDNWATTQELEFDFSPDIVYAGEVAHNYFVSATNYPGGGYNPPTIRANNRTTYLGWTDWSGTEISTATSALRCTWNRYLGRVQVSADSIWHEKGNIIFFGVVRDD